MAAFDDALRIVLRHEGGRVDDPDDPGGRTAYGVTQRTYDAYRVKLGWPKQDVWIIAPSERDDIYRDIWKASGAENIAWPLSLVHFDAWVNHSPARAAAWLAQATWAQGIRPDVMAYAYLSFRRAYFEVRASVPKQAKFLRGWLNRIESLRREAGL